MPLSQLISLDSCYHPQGRKSSTVFQMVCMMIDREFLGFDLMRRIKNEYFNAVLVAQNGTGQLAIQTLSRCVDASQEDDDRQSSRRSLMTLNGTVTLTRV